MEYATGAEYNLQKRKTTIWIMNQYSPKLKSRFWDVARGNIYRSYLKLDGYWNTSCIRECSIFVFLKNYTYLSIVSAITLSNSAKSIFLFQRSIGLYNLVSVERLRKWRQFWLMVGSMLGKLFPLKDVRLLRFVRWVCSTWKSKIESETNKFKTNNPANDLYLWLDGL